MNYQKWQAFFFHKLIIVIYRQYISTQFVYMSSVTILVLSFALLTQVQKNLGILYFYIYRAIVYVNKNWYIYFIFIYIY